MTFKQLEILTGEGGVHEMIELLKEELCNMAVSVRMLDKKSEKSLLANNKASLRLKIEEFVPPQPPADAF